MSIYLNSVTGIKASPSYLIAGSSSNPGLRVFQIPTQDGLTVQDTNNPANTIFSIRSDGNININNNQLTFADNSISVSGNKLTQSFFNIVDTTFGDVWKRVDNTPTGLWVNVAMSSDGRYQTAVGGDTTIRVSSDYGFDFAQADLSQSWFGIAMSADGRYQTATVNAGRIYTSTDYGVTWTQRDSNRFWRAVAMSADGKLQTALEYGNGIYTSTDYGVTWIKNPTAPQNTWKNIAMSADGRYQTIGTFNSFIYVSIDYGATWSPRATIGDWTDVTMSADGKYQAGAINGGQIYTTTNFFVNWNTRETNRNWEDITMSADGKYLTAVVDGGFIYVSTDQGVTWYQKETSRQWRCVSMSADGRYQLAGVLSSNLYTSRASIESADAPIPTDPQILFIEDTRAGCPGTLAANTPVQSQTFILTKPAFVKVQVNTILNNTVRTDSYLTINGEIVTKTLTSSTSMSWQPVQLFWNGILQPGTWTIDYRCTAANVIGCGAPWGKFIITFHEEI